MLCVSLANREDPLQTAKQSQWLDTIFLNSTCRCRQGHNTTKVAHPRALTGMFDGITYITQHQIMSHVLSGHR